jgi:wyosine [tRNA(Phe)-imidazoG37] synthetase (radical SAM superfamily)
VQAAVRAARARGIAVDYVSFVPTGEPTLDASLGGAIAAIKRLGLRVAVFTNGSLLWRQDVREEVALADWVSVKVDAVTDVVWRRINRPHGHLALDRVLDGVRTFARHHEGTFVTETMLVSGLNDAPEDIDNLTREIAALGPAAAWVAVPVRPPAESWVSAPASSRLNRALDIFMRRIPVVRTLIHHSPMRWRPIDAQTQQLLAMSSVHPLRESELAEVLRASGGTWAVVDALVRQERMEAVTYDGQRFYRPVRREQASDVVVAE